VPITWIVSQRLYQQVAEQLATLIRAGEFLPRQRLPPERDLALKLGVSRPTVREAMIALEIAGLVDIHSGSGIYVNDARSVSATIGDAGTSVFTILAARRAIEGEVAALAAVAPGQDFEQLEHLIDAQKTAMSQGLPGHEEDRRFHLSIAAMAGNDVLTGVVGMIWTEMFSPVFERLMEKTAGAPARQRTLRDHSAILAALANRDPAGARQAMHEHIVHTETLFLDERPVSREPTTAKAKSRRSI
jgi:DNA-binding FadR family transcriptional regulator